MQKERKRDGEGETEAETERDTYRQRGREGQKQTETDKEESSNPDFQSLSLTELLSDKVDPRDAYTSKKAFQSKGETVSIAMMCLGFMKVMPMQFYLIFASMIISLVMQRRGKNLNSWIAATLNLYSLGIINL